MYVGYKQQQPQTASSCFEATPVSRSGSRRGVALAARAGAALSEVRTYLTAQSRLVRQLDFSLACAQKRSFAAKTASASNSLVGDRLLRHELLH